MNTENKNKKIIVVGAGIAGSSLARVLAEKNWLVDIYEKRHVVGGNCYDEHDDYGILYHKYGPHIFHTDNPSVIEFVTRFAKFNGYINNPVAKVGQQLINLPINFQTIRKVFQKQATKIIQELKRLFGKQKQVSILEILKMNNPVLTQPFSWIFDNIYRPYTEKMWGTKIANVNQNVINRVSICLTDECSYFPNALLQGLPIGGYTKMIQNILSHPNINLHLDTEASALISFENQKIYWDKQLCSIPIVYCGSIDQLFQYCYGYLQYRSLEFKFIHFHQPCAQPFPIINYPLHRTMTRAVEYKQLTLQTDVASTIISQEFPGEYNPAGSKWNEPYYPLQTADAKDKYLAYLSLTKKIPNLYLLGRLAEYKYYNMDNVIARALELADKLAL